MASPAFTINLTPPPVSVGVASPVTALLDDIDGVTAVEWTIIRTDDNPASSPGAYVLVQSGAVGEQVDTTSLILGTSAALQCRINAGVDPTTGNPSDTMTTVRKFYVPTVMGFEVLNAGEFTDGNNESSPEFGPIVPVNDIARAAGLSGPPSGAASGDLSGMYPNPAVSAITDGTATQLTLGTIVDGEHLVRNGANIESDPGGGPPSGAAGGDLSGTYPNPAVSAITDGTAAQLTLGTIVDGEILVRSGATVVSAALPPPPTVFGSEFTHAVNPNLSFTANNVFITHVSLPFTSLGSGTYRIDWDFDWQRTNITAPIEVQVIGTVSGVGDVMISTTNVITTRNSASGFVYVTYAMSITETWTIEFQSPLGGGSVMRNSSIAMYRVL